VQSFAKWFLKNDELILFGSRVNLSKSGGDIDLCIKTDLTDYKEADERKILFLCDLKKTIGDQKIDIVLRLKVTPLNEHIDRIISQEGVKLA
ncbi:nucleotidyltransferase domain-containing protein, partial [bacterium]|nr:nucleotidyltransferase domain-containing protein [bacterium]